MSAPCPTPLDSGFRRNDGLRRDPKRYERAKLWIGLANLAVYIVVPVVILVSGASASIRDVIVDEITGVVVLGAVVYIVLASIVLEVLTLPLGYISGHVLEKRYELTRRSVGGWALDWLKGLGLQTVLLAVFVALLYLLLMTDPDFWWIWASLVFSAISVFLAAIAPTVLMPIFFKFEPLPEGELKDRLMRLSEQLGTFVQGAYVWKLGDKTVKANAALAGWGKTRRIIISDTLIESHDPDEIEVIIAHELGHHVNGDIWRGIGVQVVIIFVSMWVIYLALGAWSGAFGLDGTLHDFANLPLLALVSTAVGLVALPLANTYSRRRETAADDFAIATTDMRAEFISAMEKLAKQNLSNAEPHPLIETVLHSHPSVNRRIARARG
ncbi:MAG: M48 family metallopeptidase [Chloroflexi bacterium]|nr:M48 family metallopeptidase [Chloroflexota bacterium]